MRILVTGSSGFIGRSLVGKLLESYENREILGVDLRTENKAIQEITGSLVDLSVTQKIIEFNPNVVVHLAAQTDVNKSLTNPSIDGTQNYVGTACLIESLRQTECTKIIFTNSGGAIYGESHDIPASEIDPVRPISPYGISKFASEQLLELFCKNNGLLFVSLRLSNVYGPGNKQNVLSEITKSVLTGSPFVVYGDGQSTRDYIHINDVVAAILIALTSNVGGIFNLSSGTETSIRELIAEINTLTDSPVRITYTDKRIGDIQRSALDNKKIQNEFGWRPSISLAEGLKQLYDDPLSNSQE